MLGDFQDSLVPWLPLFSVGDSPISSGSLDVRSPEVLSKQCFHNSVQEWEQTWKDLPHPVGAAYLCR